ncbi:MAG: 4'-phosphopantetheinyl transferase superfamily protein [Acidobacteriota bacterium]
MIGNDIVDLDDPETGTEGLNPRFDSRVFSADERRRLAAAEDHRALRWTLWAAKESAYKLAKRRDPETIFAHSLFETDLGDDGCGTVRHGEWCCDVAVNREGSAIHAIATADHGDRQRVVFGLGEVPEGDDPSVRVRELASNSVARHLQVEPAAVMITAGEDRIPVLRVDGQPSGHLSLSHHGALAAFAWMPPSEG